MPNETVEEQVVAPVAETPVEKIHEYQPTDESGRPIGGKQVIKYTTPEELAAKLTEQNTLLIRKLREQTKKNRLGIVDTDVIEDAAPRFENPVEFKPLELSSDERATLAREILDPDTFDKAAARLFEASTGISAPKLNEVITTLQQDNASIKAQREVDKFIRRNPEYVVCPENLEAITSWMIRYDLAPVESNFQKAYDTLKADVLVTSTEVVTPQAPVVTPVEPVVEPVVTEPVTPAREEIPVENRVETPQAPAPVAHVPTGLNKGNSTDSGTPRPLADEISYEIIQRDGQGRQVGAPKVFKGLAAINAMPSEEYKRRLLQEKGFAQKVEKLNAEAAKNRRQ